MGSVQLVPRSTKGQAKQEALMVGERAGAVRVQSLAEVAGRSDCGHGRGVLEIAHTDIGRPKNAGRGALWFQLDVAAARAGAGICQ